MAKMTLGSLRKFREEHKEGNNQGKGAAESIQIIVGMGTCGIAAGAQEAFDVFLKEAKVQNIDNVIVKKTGCMGLCHAEPTVEIRQDSMPDTLYGKVDGQIARRIVDVHILGDELINDHVFDYPARDIHKE